MSHLFRKFNNHYYSQGSNSEEDPVRMFIRRNRKKILFFLLFVGLVVLTILVLVGYFILRLLKQTPQIISGSSEMISQNSDSVSQFVGWILGIIRQWGFLFGG